MVSYKYLVYCDDVYVMGGIGYTAKGKQKLR